MLNRCWVRVRFMGEFSGEPASIWSQDATRPHFDSLHDDEKTEVLIIGGGIAGILTAYFLQERGVPYILAEKGSICSGTTSCTTAKITYQHGLIYSRLLRGFGAEKAGMYLRANRAAFDKFEQLCSDMDCGYERRNNYVYSRRDRCRLENELDALSRLGFPAEFAADLPLPFETEGAVCFPEQAQFHPLKFLYSLAENLKIYENTFVREMEGTSAVTEQGMIHAEKVIVTTHFPFVNKHGSYYLKLYQHRSYVLALENAQDVGGMYVDENRKGLSFRNYGNYLLMGGGGHRTGRPGGNWNELREFAALHYPGAEEKYHWAAQDCISIDGVPYVGRYSANTPEMYTASGFNKWGMTGAMISAMLLSDMVCGVRNDYEELFSPSRSFLKPQLLVNGFEATKNLLTPSPKRCPHLGCALKWNKAEHSWDCTCHGSRFSEKGEVLDNPANGDLYNGK